MEMFMAFFYRPTQFGYNFSENIFYDETVRRLHAKPSLVMPLSAAFCLVDVNVQSLRHCSKDRF